MGLRGWWLAQRRVFQALILVTLGAIAAMGQAPWGLWPLTIASLAAAMIVISGPMRRRTAFWSGWLLGFGYFAVALHWIVEPFLVDFDRYGWMAPFGLFFMAAGGGVFWALGAVAAQIMGRGSVQPHGLAIGVFLAEMARSFLFTGFPWALIGHVAIGTYMAQLAALFGPHILTITVLALSVNLARREWFGFAALAGLLYGVVLFVDEQADPTVAGPTVRIIQPNAPQHLKWQPGYAEQFYERSLAFTAAAGSPDFVVWPETSVPFYFNTMPETLARIGQAAGDIPVVIGGLRSTETGYFNALAVIGPDGAIGDIYDKSHLVPFGEYVPFAGLFDLSDGWVYRAGDGIALVDIPGIGSALPGICYEYIFAQEVNAADGRARLMVFITNDAWFGNWAGPAQHLAQARLRAIEQGLPVVRAANTGISAVIDARGQVMGQLALNTEGYLDVALPPAVAPPLYTRWGDTPVFLFTLLLIGMSFATRRAKTVDPASPAA